MPPANTPHASAITGGFTCGARNSVAAMIERLSSTGVNAGIAKRRYTFSTPPASEVSEMNRMYGNTTRIRSAVSVAFAGSRAKAPASR